MRLSRARGPICAFDRRIRLALDLDSTMLNVCLWHRKHKSYTLSYLKRLDICSQDLESGDVQGLISRIGRSCRYLEELRLWNVCDCSKGSDLDVDFGTVTKHLIKLTHMRSLSLYHCFQWHFHEDDFEELVSHWPLLEELHLNHCTSTATILPLKAHALTLLAKYCPNIRQVTLPLDFDNYPLTSHGGNHIAYQFSVLQKLNLRISQIVESKAVSIAILLAGLSAPTSALTISHDLFQDGPDPDKFLKDIKSLMMVSSRFVHRVRHLQNRVASLETAVCQIQT